MDKYEYEKLFINYPILQQIGYNDYKIKLWVITHLHFSASQLNQNQLSKLGCESFMRSGRRFNDLLSVIDELVEHGIVEIDTAGPKPYYQLYPQTEYDFAELLSNVRATIKRTEPSTITELFIKCLANENEGNFLVDQNMSKFFNTIANDKTKFKMFSEKFLHINASSWAMFVIIVLQQLDII